MNDWKFRLKQAREAKELNKTEFARLVGVSNATVTDWEKSAEDGGIKELSGPKLAKLSEILGVDPHWIISGKQAPDKGAAEARPDPVRKIEPEAANLLQWVTPREADLLSTFRSITGIEQEAVAEVAKSFLPATASRRGAHKA